MHGKVCTKHILRLLWKMVENMFFLGSEHIGMRGKCPQPHPQKLLFLLIEWGENKFKCRATRSVHYRNSDLILSHQRNFTCVIILTIPVCLMQKCINHPISQFILPVSVIIFLHWRRINIINKINGNIWLMIDIL